MIRTVYLIDSENVADHWVGRIKLNSSLDKVIIFWSRNSRGISIWLMDAFLKSYPCEQVEFVECYTGSNSMDFHVVAKLGQMTARPTKTHFVIVSDDTGYDGVINHLFDEGFSVKRLAGFKDKPQSPRALTPRSNLVTSYTDDKASVSKQNTKQTSNTAAAGKVKPQKPANAIKWGMNEAGKQLTITSQQEASIKKNLQELFHISQYAESHQKEIVHILSTATYPCKKHMGDIYQRLCKMPQTKVKKITFVYQCMKKTTLPAIDLIMGY